jgi:signal transduction histidine kinase
VNAWERFVAWFGARDPKVVDAVQALGFTVVGLLSVFTQDLVDGLVEPGPLAVLTTLVTTAAVAWRRRAPLAAVVVACAGILAHIAAGYPEGSLPFVIVFLSYSVGAWEPPRRSLVGLAIILVTLALVAASDAPGLDALGTIANAAFFIVAWAVGFAMHARRETTELTLRQAEERADVERQRAARMLAEERLRLAQELHDVVAHSMSVIAVQAGVGAHVIDTRPDQARSALEAISATSRGTLAELRRLLGVLRDDDGERAHAPAPALADLPRLVADVRAAGLPVTLEVEGSCGQANPAVELSAYRIVQEALTNVLKHAGSPTKVAVKVEHLADAVRVEVVDDGRGAASAFGADHGGSGHGLLGMRERVALWGGELTVGPAAGGGFRVRALLPYGAEE